MAENKSCELSLSPFHGINAADDLDLQNSMRIEKKLLIDADQLVIGPVISEGHDSIVHKGEYKSMPVAIKVMQPTTTESTMSPKVQEKFYREVLILSKIKHDSIIKLVGATVDPSMMIITEFMSRGTLQKFLWSIRPACLHLTLSISFALDISKAMEFLHQNSIIHRDLKPSNLLLTEDKRKIKVADFGLAREVDEGEMTTEAGTYRWMAPELFSREALPLGVKKHYDRKVDVYSFSLILWELLTNNTPFKGRNNVMVAYAVAMNQRPSLENIPEEIKPLLHSCWDQDPNARPEFEQITEFLKTFLHKICQPSAIPPTTHSVLLNAEFSRSKEKGDDSLPINILMERSKETREKSKSLCLRFLRCFGYCI